MIRGFRKSSRADGRGQGSWTVISQVDAKVSPEMDSGFGKPELQVVGSQVAIGQWAGGVARTPGSRGQGLWETDWPAGHSKRTAR